MWDLCAIALYLRSTINSFLWLAKLRAIALNIDLNDEQFPAHSPVRLANVLAKVLTSAMT